MGYQVTEKSTVHGLDTPHGLNTPHKLPEVTAQASKTLGILSDTLYPTGLAWSMDENSILNFLHEALNVSFARIIKDADATTNSSIPDNTSFDEDDINIWEHRLGLITNEDKTIEERRTSLLLKMAYPNNIKARQHPNYIENQLQQNGFNVFIHENTAPYETPEDIIAGLTTETQHGFDVQHGSTQHGSGLFNVIANSLFPGEVYNVGGSDNLWSTFFITGGNINDIGIVPQTREIEFRELVLKLKPAHTIAYTIINFI